MLMRLTRTQPNSMCGAGMAGQATSTLGAERISNPYLDPKLTKDAFIQKLLGHLVIVDAKLFKSSEYGVCLGNIVLDGEAYPPVVTEVLDGFQGHGVHSVRADEFFGIQDIAIGWVLGAGAGP